MTRHFPAAPACILAVEDNPANLELMSYLLRSRGHRVVEARTARQVRDLLASPAAPERIDVLVLDIRLPDDTGLDLLVELRAAGGLATVPAVAVTAYAMAGDREAAIAAGFEAYVVKPIDPRTFADTVEALVTTPEPGAPSPLRAPAPAGDPVPEGQ